MAVAPTPLDVRQQAGQGHTVVLPGPRQQRLGPRRAAGSRRHRCAHRRSTSAPRERQSTDQVLVATIDVVRPADHRLPVGHQPGQHQGHSGTDVRGAHRSPRETGHPAHHGVVALGSDVGTHASELLHVAETSGEEILGQDPDPVGHREHGHEQRAVVGGHPRVGQRGHVGRREAPPGAGPQTLGSHVGGHTHLVDLAQQHLHVVGPGVGHGDLSPGHPGGGQVGRGHHPVGHHPMVHRVKLVDALDLDPRRPRPVHHRAHGAQHGGQVGHLGLLGGVLNHCRAFGQDRGHEEIVGGRVARVLEHHPSPDQPATGHAAADLAV